MKFAILSVLALAALASASAIPVSTIGSDTEVYSTVTLSAIPEPSYSVQPSIKYVGDNNVIGVVRPSLLRRGYTDSFDTQVYSTVTLSAIPEPTSFQSAIEYV
ncbi:hypothetical protein GGI09_002514 [Coemansia sp. S100]|nr:hypothetical protein LPJ71_000703 [Coemansia sp. S17]KAJ2099958.1 hypothetical protein GGI09_002514 [Coemansia sp. S100]KAJ2109574.1 hypothetical protein GGI16_000675 [Coemansia sp. S142-1]